MHRSLAVMISAMLVACSLAAQDIDDSPPQDRLTLKHAGRITTLAVAPNGKTLAAAAFDIPYRVWKLRLWDLPTGKPQATFWNSEDPQARVRVLRFSPDSTLLASASDDHVIRVWDVAAKRVQATMEGSSAARALAFSPDGKILAAASHDKTITLWNLRTAKSQTIETGHRTWVREILFAPSGGTMASRDYYDVKLWSAAGHELQAIEGRLSAMRFSAVGNRLTVGSGHRVAHVELSRLEPPRILEGREYRAYDRLRARLSPDGRTLATIDKDLASVSRGQGLGTTLESRCRLILMDVESGEQRTILEQRGSENRFGPLWFSPNGHMLEGSEPLPRSRGCGRRKATPPPHRARGRKFPSG